MKISPSRSSARSPSTTSSSVELGGQAACAAATSVLGALGVAPTDPVDGQEPGGRVQPGRRVVGYAVLPPLLEGRDEGVLGQLLGGVEVADLARQAGDDPRRLDPPQRRQPGGRRSTVRCLAASAGAVSGESLLGLGRRSSNSITLRTSTRSLPTSRANLRACSTASVERADLEDREAGDQLLGLGERAVDHPRRRRR